MFGSTSECWRERWVHLGVSQNSHWNHKPSLRDAWVLMDNHSGECRCYLRLSACTQAFIIPQRQISYMNYCSLSLLNHTSCHLLQHCIYCLTTLRNQTKGQVIPERMQLHWNDNPTKQLNDINPTWCQCYPLLLPSHPGWRKQEHTIRQALMEAAGTPWIYRLCVTDKWMKSNSKVLWLNLFNLPQVHWDFGSLRINMGVWQVIRYGWMKMERNNQEQRSARCEVLSGTEEYTEGVGVAWNGNEQRLI